MRIISKRRLQEFWRKYPNAEQPLLSWYETTKRANWENFTDVRETFNHADIYEDCVIFDIGGYKFRLITKIRYRVKKVFIRFVLTHSDYDKGIWKADCEC